MGMCGQCDDTLPNSENLISRQFYFWQISVGKRELPNNTESVSRCPRRISNAKWPKIGLNLKPVSLLASHPSLTVINAVLESRVKEENVT